MQSGANPLMEAALGYLARGFSVVPLHNIADGHCTCQRGPECKSPGKHVRLPSWAKYQRELPSESDIRKWWTTWPEANIGVIMGKVSGVFAADCDGADKEAYVVGICGGVPDTETHYAKRGPHYFWLYPGDGEVPSCMIGPRVEIISDGKLVVAPPSMHVTGVRYETNGERPAEAPDMLLRIIREDGIREGSHRIDPEELKKMLRGVPKGERHPVLIRLVGRWVEKGLTLDEIEQQALGWNAILKDPEPAENILVRARDGYRRWHEEVKGDTEEIEVSHDVDGLTVFWPQGVEVSFRRMRIGSDDCEVYVSFQGREKEWRRFNVSSGSQRDDLRRVLEKDPELSKFQWPRILGRSCLIADKEHRTGGQIQKLVPSPAPACQNLVEPFAMPLGETSVLYGDGGTGKSTLALLIAVALALGREIPGLPAFHPNQRVRVIYLDWESTIEEHADRLAAILESFGAEPEDLDGWLYYFPMQVPLSDDAEFVREEVKRRDIGFVIVDSYVMAAGFEAEKSEAARRVMEALRSLQPATSLIITHIPGTDAREESNNSRPYGSVFVRNLPRSVWEVRLNDQITEGLDNIRLILQHRKVNRGRLQGRFAIVLDYENARIVSWRQDRTRDDDKGSSNYDRMMSFVRQAGAKVTYEEIARACSMSEHSVRALANVACEKGLLGREYAREGGRNRAFVFALDRRHEDPAAKPTGEEAGENV